MADMIGLLRFGAPAAPAQTTQPAVKPLPAIAAVSDTSGSGGAQASGGFGTAHPDTASILKPQPAVDPDMLTGPPPSFQASLLELQSDLRNSLARIEATRPNRNSFGTQVGDSVQTSGVD